jgi:regulator of nonsense transcripts 2
MCLQIQNASKLRVDLRFYAELINAGVFSHKVGLPMLGSMLTVLTGSDKEEHNNVNIILSFCKHCGEDYAGTLMLLFLYMPQKSIFQLCTNEI